MMGKPFDDRTVSELQFRQSSHSSEVIALKKTVNTLQSKLLHSETRANRMHQKMLNCQAQRDATLRKLDSLGGIVLQIRGERDALFAQLRKARSRALLTDRQMTNLKSNKNQETKSSNTLSEGQHDLEMERDLLRQLVVEQERDIQLAASEIELLSRSLQLAKDHDLVSETTVVENGTKSSEISNFDESEQEASNFVHGGHETSPRANSANFATPTLKHENENLPSSEQQCNRVEKEKGMLDAFSDKNQSSLRDAFRSSQVWHRPLGSNGIGSSVHSTGSQGLLRRLAQREQEAHALGLSLATESRKRQQVESELVDARLSLEESELQMNRLRDELQKQSQSTEKLTEEIQNKFTELKRSRMEINVLQNAMVEASEKMNKLSSLLQIEKSKSKQLEQDIRKRESEKDELQEILDSQTQDVCALKELNEHLRNEARLYNRHTMTELRGALEKSEIEIATLNEQICCQTSLLEELQDRLQDTHHPS